MTKITAEKTVMETMMATLIAPKMAPKRIHQYITKGAGHRKRTIGVLVGEQRDCFLHIGWSKANESKGDKFDKDFGMDLAIKRLNARDIVPVPHSIYNAVRKFEARCYRYFKGCGVFSKIKIQPNKPKKVVEIA